MRVNNIVRLVYFFIRVKFLASMWTISINSAINDGQNAHYDESCSSTLASTFSNGK